MLRIAIIEPDEPVPSVVEQYGTYGDIFSRLLQIGGLDFSTHPYEIIKYDIVNKPLNYPSVDINSPLRPDIVLITGSRRNAYDDDEWTLRLVDFVKECFSLDPSSYYHKFPIKVIGICYGHQIIARALGANVNVNPKGWEISATKVKLSEKGVEIFPEFSSSGEISIMQMHRDVVLEVPVVPDSDIHVLGSTDTCAIQGLYKKNLFWSLQGHPEFDKLIVEGLIVDRHKKGLFTDELVTDGLSRVGIETDGNVIAKAMVRFIHEQ